MWSNSALLNQYESLQTRLLRYYPGEHELQIKRSQINKEHKFVITPHLRIHVTKNSARLTTSLSRATGIWLSGAAITQANQLRYVVTPLQLIRSDKSNHANLLILDLLSTECVWFEPHGSDITAPGHPAAIINYYEPAAIKAVLNSVLHSLHTQTQRQFKLITPCDLPLARVWGQSITKDSYCSFWCLLFFEQSILGQRAQFIAQIDSFGKEELRKFIEMRLMDSTALLRNLMQNNVSSSISDDSLVASNYLK